MHKQSKAMSRNTHGLPTHPKISAERMRAIGPFNTNPQFCERVQRLIQKYTLDTAIETGTWLGKTTEWLSKNFKQVHTIELNEARYDLNRSTLDKLENVTAWCGSSAEILPKVISEVPEKSRVLFYLDAHWGKNCPLLKELEAISKVPWLVNNCIIVIDDFKVPGRPDVPYDSYQGHAFDLNYVSGQLQKIMDPLEVSYYAPPKTNARSRGKLLVIPKQWQSENRKVLQKQN